MSQRSQSIATSFELNLNGIIIAGQLVHRMDGQMPRTCIVNRITKYTATVKMSLRYRVVALAVSLTTRATHEHAHLIVHGILKYTLGKVHKVYLEVCAW